MSTYNVGKLLNGGICVTITGKPNVGKSTLLNQLSGLEKAIVSNQPGTTRDLVEVMLDLDGIPIRFVDTAGIHQTDDKLEKMGIDNKLPEYYSLKKLQAIRDNHIDIFDFNNCMDVR